MCICHSFQKSSIHLLCNKHKLTEILFHRLCTSFAANMRQISKCLSLLRFEKKILRNVNVKNYFGLLLIPELLDGVQLKAAFMCVAFEIIAVAPVSQPAKINSQSYLLHKSNVKGDSVILYGSQDNYSCTNITANRCKHCVSPAFS